MDILQYCIFKYSYDKMMINHILSNIIKHYQTLSNIIKHEHKSSILGCSLVYLLSHIFSVKK